MLDITVLWRSKSSCALPDNGTLFPLIHNVQGKSGTVIDQRNSFFVKPFSVTLFTRRPNTRWQKVSSNVSV